MVSKKRKSAASAEWQRKKKALKSEAAAAVNPFELRFTRPKHEVLGQRVKGRIGSRGKSRDAAIQKRKKTLLVEMDNRDRTGLFLDKRFGEYDESISAEERMLQRFQFERVKRHEKSSAFNLPDTEEEGLTHGGQSLGQMLDDYVPSDDEEGDEEGELLGAANTGRLNFGGFEPKAAAAGDEDAEDRPRTRKEIMEEVVMKSKMHKMERQKEALELSNKIEELDDQFDEHFKMLIGEASLRAEAKMEAAPKKKQDSYDRLVRELTFEARGKATDRMKTAEERAWEERDRLEQLEAERVRRMEGGAAKADGKADPEASVEFLGGETRATSKPAELKYIGDGKYEIVGDIGTPLHDGKKLDAHDRAERDLDRAVAGRKDDGDDSHDDEDEDIDTDEEVDSDDEDAAASTATDGHDASEDAKSDEEDDNAADTAGSAAKAVGRRTTKASKRTGAVARAAAAAKADDAAALSDLPFTFDMPADVAALRELLDGRKLDEQGTIVSRIGVCHDVRLGAANRAKMGGFFRTLLLYALEEVASSPSKGLPVADNLLAGPLFDISQQVPEAAADCILAEMDAVAAIAAKKKIMFVNLRELLLLQVVRHVFPVSDFRHRVVTPAFLLLGAALSAKTIRSAEDVVSGVACAALALDYATPAARLFPEPITFLTDVLALLTGSGRCSWVTIAEELSDRDFTVRTVVKAAPGALELSWMDAYPHRPIAAKWWASVVCRSLEVLSGFARLYKDIVSFSAIFAASVDAAAALMEAGPAGSAVFKAAESFTDLVNSRSGRILEPLRLQKHRPVALRSMEPDFDEGYSGRKVDHDKDRRETRKLKALYKKEERGAIRELRRDGKFMARVKLDKRRAFDAERDAVTKGFENELAQDLGNQRIEEKIRLKRKGKLK
mmetsp:Transcript_26205/g.78749  ORF Transcript_26205/g.78749 Transcript_26205/m.78749 type:complete len:897 (-) Transcript_26205:128-2818(-)